MLLLLAESGPNILHLKNAVILGLVTFIALVKRNYEVRLNGQ